MNARYNLPASTAAQVHNHISRCKNLSLILDRYPPEDVVEDPKNKGPWLQERIENNPIDPALAQAVYKRWRNMMLTLKATLFDATLDWRMVMGLGAESVLETALTLHRLYGLPYIPASALKGLTRAYLTGEVEGYQRSKEEDDNDEVKRIFGTRQQAGSVLFFDALPVDGKVAFVLDIMNPHYSEYYSGGNRPPTNEQKPIPVTFLTIADAAFTFALAPRKDQHRKDVEKVRIWLHKALQTYGIGGKTSAGYGYFKIDQPTQAQSGASTSRARASSKPTEHIRPKIPTFREGQEITGSVVSPTDDLRRLAPPGVQAFLSYQSFATREALMIVNATEAQSWRTGETRICLFLREEEHNGCTVLVCQPRVKRKKK